MQHGARRNLLRSRLKVPGSNLLLNTHTRTLRWTSFLPTIVYDEDRREVNIAYRLTLILRHQDIADFGDVLGIHLK